MRLKVTDNFESFKGENQNRTKFNSGFQGLKNDLENEINSKFEWIEGEIDIAIESLKAKLDLINESIQAKIQESKEKVKK